MTPVQHDSLGEIHVPHGALYGPQTARAVENFPISGWPMPRRFLLALGTIKQAAADAHKQAGRLDEEVADAISTAAGEVAAGTHDAQFPVDVFQTGSGTSTNMNANEVIAHRASELLEGQRVHPNDHVNQGQSSNDVIPTALQVAAAVAIHDQLLPALRQLRETLQEKAAAFDDVVKIGRTHLMDAVPVRLGQEFRGYAGQLDAAIQATQIAMTDLCELPLGGTAVGTGLNAPADFASNVCLFLSEELRLPFLEASNHFAAQSNADVALRTSGTMKACAIVLGKIASDIRLLASGPRCGLGELTLPALQPGSSIMPGKVNPVLCESVVQVACQVVGCDAAIAAGATGGVGSLLQLNVCLPMIAVNLLTQIELLANVSNVFREKCLQGLKANQERCEQFTEQSLAMITVLAPVIGYDRAAALAKQAHETGQTVRELCHELLVADGTLSEEKLKTLLDAKSQTGA